MTRAIDRDVARIGLVVWMLAGLGCSPVGPADRIAPDQGGTSGSGTGGSGKGGSNPASGGNVASGGAPGTGGMGAGAGGMTGTAGAGGGSPDDANPGSDTDPGIGGAGGVSGAGGASGTGSAAGAGGVSGAGGTPATGYHFGSHPLAYPPGSIRPSGGQAALDAAVAAAYDKWKAAYVMAGCGGFMVKTMHGEPDQITGSSGIGRAMILAAMMAGHDPDAQKLFDGLFTVARMKPSQYKGNEALVAYAIRTGCTTKPDDGSTFEGDADFAFALLLADKQWGSAGAVKYMDEAKKTIPAMKKFEMNPTLKLPLSGDWASLPGEAAKGWFTDTKAGNLMLGHFRAFAAAAADPFWMDTVVALQKLIDTMQTQYSPAGFVPEYLDESKPAKVGYAIADDRAHAGDFGANAGILMFRLAADYVASKDAATKAEFSKITDALKKAAGGDPTKIVDGYLLAGTAFGTKGTPLFIAPAAAAAIFDAGNQAWLDGLWKIMAASAAAGVDSETDSTNLLGMLLASGNWWSP